MEMEELLMALDEEGDSDLVTAPAEGEDSNSIAAAITAKAPVEAGLETAESTPPQAGSSLSDVATRAVPDGEGFESDPLGPRYRLKGNKMWISAGEHELTENIIHLVLAKIPGPAGKPVPGTRGISLFIVPKRLVDTDGQLTGERNDVALAGLNHKCGWRGTTNTLLNFGEGKYPVRGEAGAVGYLVGQPGKGLQCMFHMMNEARIGVGLAAPMLGMAGLHDRPVLCSLHNPTSSARQ